MSKFLVVVFVMFSTVAVADIPVAKVVKPQVAAKPKFKEQVKPLAPTVYAQLKTLAKNGPTKKSPPTTASKSPPKFTPIHLSVPQGSAGDSYISLANVSLYEGATQWAGLTEQGMVVMWFSSPGLQYMHSYALDCVVAGVSFDPKLTWSITGTFAVPSMTALDGHIVVLLQPDNEKHEESGLQIGLELHGTSGKHWMWKSCDLTEIE